MSETPAHTLPVNDLFASFQGEGWWLGRAAFFIRLQGCPLRCAWCDSAGTWPKDGGVRFSVEVLAEMAAKEAAEIVIVTGGEPAMHDLRALTAALKGAGKRVHIETSGAFPLNGYFDWITVSPKRAKTPLPENIARADELKLIIETPADIEEWLAALPAELPNCKALWLQPEWNRQGDGTVCRAITEAVKTRAGIVRAGVQLHKFYNADEIDPRFHHVKDAPRG